MCWGSASSCPQYATSTETSLVKSVEALAPSADRCTAVAWLVYCIRVRRLPCFLGITWGRSPVGWPLPCSETGAIRVNLSSPRTREEFCKVSISGAASLTNVSHFCILESSYLAARTRIGQEGGIERRDVTVPMGAEDDGCHRTTTIASEYRLVRLTWDLFPWALFFFT